jgi:O-antigen ligase
MEAVIDRPHRSAISVRYLLFAYGATLGLPDIALALGGVVRVRLDDLAVMCLCLLLPFATERRSSDPQARRILWSWLLFAAACTISLVVTFSFGARVDWYPVSKMAGTVALLVALTRFVTTPRLLYWLCRGLLVAAGLLIAQLVLRYQGIVGAPDLTAYHTFKGAMGFGTWNPNTLGMFAIPLSFGAYLGWTMERPNPLRWVWLAGAMACAAIPVFILARGPSIAMLAGWLVCLYVSRVIRLRMLLGFAGVLALGYAWLRYSEMGASATNIDLRTGQGFSGRYTMWATAWELFRERPFLGWGFTREIFLFKERLGKGVPHSVYFSVLVELGLFGLLLYLRAWLGTFRSVARIAARNVSLGWIRAGLLGMLTASAVAGLAEGMIWMKSSVLGICLAIICVRLAATASSPPGESAIEP